MKFIAIYTKRFELELEAVSNLAAAKQMHQMASMYPFGHVKVLGIYPEGVLPVEAGAVVEEKKA